MVEQLLADCREIILITNHDRQTGQFMMMNGTTRKFEYIGRLFGFSLDPDNTTYLCGMSFRENPEILIDMDINETPIVEVNGSTKLPNDRRMQNL